MLLKNQLKLLPHKFQKVGYFLAALTVVAFALFMFLNIINLSESTTKLSLYLSLMISFGFVVLAQEKQEDELVKQVREFSLAIMFFGLLAFAVVDVCWQLILNEPFFYSLAATALYLEVVYLATFKGRLKQLSE